MPYPPLFVREWGTGAPVVFLHGLGASSRYWERLVTGSSGYQGVAPDLLGFGRSPKPDDATYDVATHLDAIAPLARPASLVVGHSAGAILAVALAATRPQLVKTLLLLGLPAFPDETTARQEVGRLGLLARLTVQGRPFARVLCDAMCRLRPVATAIAPLIIRDLPRAIASDGARHTWPSYHGTLQHVVVEHRALPDLLATDVPVALLQGADDRAAPVGYARALVEAAGAEGRQIALQIVEGDHHLAVRRPNVVATLVSRWAATGGQEIS
ncbi:MAG: alpha/beta fold hydrolase [Acidimicrobiia bacterium]